MQAKLQVAQAEVFEDKAVCNPASRIWHRVVQGPPVFDPPEWATSCGWKFGNVDKINIASMTELPSNPDWLCGRCLREHREAAVNVARHALRHAGEPP